MALVSPTGPVYCGIQRQEAAVSYIDEHIEWLRSKGVEVLPEFSKELHGEFRPEHDPESLKALPPDVALWHEARMCGRVSGEAIVGGRPPAAGGGAFPVPFVSMEQSQLVVETVGERAGWVYSVWPDLGSGPVAKSIPQYLMAVRGLLDAGLLSFNMAEDPAWSSDDQLPPSALLPSPPLDTPGGLVGFDPIPFSSVIVLLRSFVTFGPPIAASICDLVPGFEIVTMDYGPDGRG